MAYTTERDLRLVHPPPRETRKVVPNEVLGTMIFVLAEIMMFAGFISAFIVAGASVDAWPPPDQPRLPVEETALNTLALLISGGVTWWAGRKHAESPQAARWPLAAGMALGAFFVLFQGFEWWGLLSDGLGFTTSTHASFFYLIVGAHALHAIGGLGVMVWMFTNLQRGALTSDQFWAGRLFWYFVVLLWPVLYWQVYLT
jgi:cytochrome c oxidase subunit 3